MDVITIESIAFKQILEKLNTLVKIFESLEQPENLTESWVDSQEVCRFLKISERTLQRLRTKGVISYSSFGGKYYYQISQLKKLLEQHLIKSTHERLGELISHHKTTNRK